MKYLQGLFQEITPRAIVLYKLLLEWGFFQENMADFFRKAPLGFFPENYSPESYVYHSCRKRVLESPKTSSEKFAKVCRTAFFDSIPFIFPGGIPG